MSRKQVGARLILLSFLAATACTKKPSTCLRRSKACPFFNYFGGTAGGGVPGAGGGGGALCLAAHPAHSIPQNAVSNIMLVIFFFMAEHIYSIITNPVKLF